MAETTHGCTLHNLRRSEEFLCSELQLFLPNAEWGLHREAQQSAGVPGEDVADLSPLIRLQQGAVRRVLDAVAQVHQAAHQNLDICRGMTCVTTLHNIPFLLHRLVIEGLAVCGCPQGFNQ